MLTLEFAGTEVFNEETNEFLVEDPVTISLEHSLVSLSKWESEFQIPFITDDKKTEEQTIAYVRAMMLADDYPIDLTRRLTSSHIEQVSTYIENQMTATRISEMPKQSGPRSSEFITAELIYYWMVALTIPFECERWHLNKLLTLVKVTNLKNQPPKKMPRKEAMSRQAALNASRKAQLGTSG